MKKPLKKFLWGTFIAFAVAGFPFWGVELGMLIQGLMTGEYCDKPTPCGYWGLVQWFFPIWFLLGAGIWLLVFGLVIFDVLKEKYKKSL